jgi:hypothetical protein
MVSQKKACSPKKPSLQKKEAQLSPAYEAYRGWGSRYLALHQLFVGNYGHWVVTLVLLLGAATGFVLAYNEQWINPNHARYCCYPTGAVHGSLGSCTDPGAAIHSATHKLECPSYGALYLICVSAAGALLVANYIYIQSTRKAFFEKAVEDLMSLKAFVAERQNLVAQKQLREYEVVYLWISRHTFSFLVVLLPESFFFGAHLRTLGRTALFWMYNAFLWGGGILAVLFFTTALPMDKAWRCYPDPSIFATTLGRCDVANSTASRRFHVRSDEHIVFFWVSLGIWVAAHTIVLSIYGYTIFDFKRLYARHILKKLRSIKSST